MNLPDLHSLEKAYRQMTDGELLQWAADMDSLTDAARTALAAEMRSRNLDVTRRAAELCAELSDGEILRRAEDFSTLTDDARVALNAELRRRGMQEILLDSTQAEPEAMSSGHTKRRSAVVTYSAVLLLGCSGLMLLFAALEPLGVRIAVAHGARPVPPAMRVAWFAFTLGAPGVWGLVTAIGILRLRPWARVSILVLCITETLSLLQNLQSAFMHLSWGEGLATAATGAVVVLWLDIFTDESVEKQFRAAYPAPQRSLAHRRPASITIIAIWLLAMPPVLAVDNLPVPAGVRALTQPFSAGFSTIPIGALSNGGGLTVYDVALAALGLVLGFGLLRMKPWARATTIAFSVFTVVNRVVELLVPHMAEQLLGTARFAAPTRNSEILYVIAWAQLLWYTGLPAAAVWFLIRRKAAFISGFATQQSG